MSPLADMLHAVRRKLASGWDPVTCRTEDGTACTVDDEGVWTFDLLAAVQTSARTGAERLAVWAALDLATDGFAYTWSLEPGRTHTDVMMAVARAEKRAERESR